jgi:anaerobic selenocysteine-containing dehydrogenase
LVSTENQPYALVSGTVLFDGGNLFHLTTKMQDMAFGAKVGINPEDAAKLKVADGATVKVANRNGELKLTAKLDTQVQQGTIWIPESLPGAPVGALLNGRAVEYVRVEPVK